jgi:glycosyltransferase involved in cell wall biosynthesis
LKTKEKGSRAVADSNGQTPNGNGKPFAGTGSASVLIPVLNEESHLPETTRAMLAQHFDGDIEFLFVDGGSTDRTREMLEELAAQDPRVRVFDNPARQTTAALNIALRNARGEYVVRMDAHSEYPSNYIAGAVERLRKGDVHWVCGPAIAEGEGPWSATVAAALQTPLGQGGSRKWAPGQTEVELDTGVFTGVWRREYLEELGGWDEGWPINQDSELAARVFEHGGRIVCLPELAACYTPRNSPKSLARQYWRYGYYRTKTSRFHPDSMRRPHAVAPAIVLTLLAAVIGPSHVRTAARAAIGAYVAALFAVSLRAFLGAEGERPDLLRMPAALAIMHLSWGGGFFAASARFGPPLAALRRLVPGARTSLRGKR